MPSIDVRRRRIAAKIVYYGPGLSGKTENLRQIHRLLKPGRRGRLASLSVKGTGNQRIDLLPVRFGTIKGLAVTLNLCSVPGQAFQNKARKLTLKAADGVVFVADSRRSRMVSNVDSLHNLRENLEAYSIQLEQMMHVIQYNQRDRPDALPVSELRAKLNPYGVPEFEACATKAQGVMKTFTGIARLVLQNIKGQL